jgi:hypothetical protein
MTDAQPSADADALARKLHAAQARLAAAGLPAPVRAQLQRKFIAICDAVKAPGAGPACQRRLDCFIATLDGVIAEHSGYKN